MLKKGDIVTNAKIYIACLARQYQKDVSFEGLTDFGVHYAFNKQMFHYMQPMPFIGDIFKPEGSSQIFAHISNQQVTSLGHDPLKVAYTYLIEEGELNLEILYFISSSESLQIDNNHYSDKKIRRSAVMLAIDTIEEVYEHFYTVSLAKCVLLNDNSNLLLILPVTHLLKRS